MSIIALLASALVIVALFVSALASVVASGSPAFYVGFLTPREMQISRPDPMIGALSVCDEQGTRFCGAPKTAPMQAVNPMTLQGIPAVIAPSYAAESVTIMAPVMIGDHRDARGRFMPRYKA